jgi:hypothetical protein
MQFYNLIVLMFKFCMWFIVDGNNYAENFNKIHQTDLKGFVSDSHGRCFKYREI